MIMTFLNIVLGIPYIILDIYRIIQNYPKKLYHLHSFILENPGIFL